MTRTRIDLYRREKPRKQRSGRDWRTLPAPTYVKAFLALTFVMASLAGFFWLVGMDFAAEHRGPYSNRLSTCGFLLAFTPQHLHSTTLCVFYNLAPFFVMPALVLLLLVRRLLSGRGPEDG